MLKKPTIQLVLAALLWPVAVGAATIESVVMEYGYSEQQSSTRRYVRRQANKFERPNLVPSSQHFYVRWRPDPGRPVPRGSQLVFEYRQSRNPEVRALAITYPFDVQDLRLATFTLPENVYRAAGSVHSWRVRLLVNRQVVAQRQSRNWRP